MVCTHDFHFVWVGSGPGGYTKIKCHHCDLELTLDDVLAIIKVSEEIYQDLLAQLKGFSDKEIWSYDEH